MEEIIDILKEVKPGVDFSKEKNLVEEEVIDSFDIVNLVAKLDENFDIEITPADLVPENFASAETIKNLVDRLQDE